MISVVYVLLPISIPILQYTSYDNMWSGVLLGPGTPGTENKMLKSLFWSGFYLCLSNNL